MAGKDKRDTTLLTSIPATRRSDSSALDCEFTRDLPPIVLGAALRRFSSVPKTMTAASSAREVMTAAEMSRAFKRMAHEIIERNKGAHDLALAGIPTRGVHLATRLAHLVGQFESVLPEWFAIDPTPFRDDAGTDRRFRPALAADIPEQPTVGVDGMRVVIVDDVFNTGRTARAAIDALMQFGRPARVQLAVLINRGHRELPISPDFVGKHIPTARSERVNVQLEEVDGRDAVSLVRGADGTRS